MQNINIGVIPVGGEGNRIKDLPFTKFLPKPMLPVLNRPIVEYAVENMKKIGIRDLYFILGRKGHTIRRYFQGGKEFNINITYVEDRTLSGLANAIHLVEHLIHEPFCVILGDDLTINNSWKGFVNEFFLNKCIVLEGVVKDDNKNSIMRACEVQLDSKNKIIDIVEKPKVVRSKIRGCGVYIFGPEIFKLIKKTKINPITGRKELTDTIKLASKIEQAYAGLLDGINININTLEDLIQANRLILKSGFLKVR